MKIAFVPLRCGSKSIPFKNIKNFCGKALSFWNLEALEKSNIDKIVVATDCDKIEKVIKDFGFSKLEIYRRKSENAQDNSSTESVMLEFLEQAKLNSKDIFMLVQATSVLSETKDFNEALEQFENVNCDSLLSCVKTKRFFWTSNFKALNYDFSKRPRRQDFEGLFMENGAFYISKVDDILASKNRISGKIVIYEMEEYKGIEIDEELDWDIAEFLMKKYQAYRLTYKTKPIKLFVSDVDGTLTDGGMYYFDNKIEGKKFNTLDGKGFEILRECKIKTALLTGENNEIIMQRGKKLKIDYIYMGLNAQEKLEKLKEICKKEKINMDEVAYIGDDINCKFVLEEVGLKACPNNAHQSIKAIKDIICLSKNGGEGVVREFIDGYVLSKTDCN